MRRTSIFYSLLTIFFLTSLTDCAHKQQQADIIAEHIAWETKAQIKQVKSGQINQVSIDVLAVKGSKLRLDVTATLGYRVASVILDRNHIQALIPNEKKYYAGQVTPEIMARFLKMPVYPSLLYAMIFDQGLKGAGWLCHYDETGLVKDCAFKDSLSLVWERLEAPQKIVRLKTKSIEMDWLFKSLDSEWTPKPEVFTLKVPNNYQSVQL